MRTAIISNSKFREKISDDLVLRQLLIEYGIESEIISWEEENDYDFYDNYILRSVWGYQDKYNDFKKWLNFMENKKLFNSSKIIRDNIRKNIQFSILDKYNIPHVETLFTSDIGIIDEADSKVIKPIISGSGRNTFVINRDNKERIALIYEQLLQTEDNGIMIQPKMNIDDGEYACVFIDGIYCYSMLRFPGIFGKKQKPVYLDSIPNNVSILANKVADIPEYEDCLYMRVDIIVNEDKAYIMEVELAEPDLMMKYIPNEQVKRSSVNKLVKRLECIR